MSAGNTIPPAFYSRKSIRAGYIPEHPLIVFQKKYRIPGPAQDQVGITIPVKISEHCARNQSCLPQSLRMDVIWDQRALIAGNQPRGGLHGIVTRNKPAAYKKVRSSISVVVGSGHGTCGRNVMEQGVDLTMINAVLVGRRELYTPLFIIGIPRQNFYAAAVFPPENSRLISGCGLAQPRQTQRTKSAIAQVFKYTDSSSFTRSNKQVVVSVPVDIYPGKAGAQLTKSNGKQRLYLKIIKRTFLMTVIDPVGDVFKQGLFWSARFSLFYCFRRNVRLI